MTFCHIYTLMSLPFQSSYRAFPSPHKASSCPAVMRADPWGLFSWVGFHTQVSWPQSLTSWPLYGFAFLRVSGLFIRWMVACLVYLHAHWLTVCHWWIYRLDSISSCLLKPRCPLLSCLSLDTPHLVSSQHLWNVCNILLGFASDIFRKRIINSLKHIIHGLVFGWVYINLIF